jgi:hypothetical protein
MLTPIEQALVKVGYARGNFNRWYASAPNVPCVPQEHSYDVLIVDEHIKIVPSLDVVLCTCPIPVIAVFDNVPDFIRYCGDNRPAPQGYNVWD